MKHLKSFNKLNEEVYEGPGKKIGFKYSGLEPKEEYIISVDLIINPKLDLDSVRRSIKRILTKCKVTENWFRLTKYNKEGDIEVPGDEPGDVYTLAIGLTAYARHEASTALNEILFAIMDKYGRTDPPDIFFDEKHINLGGTDLDIEPSRIGYKKDFPSPKSKMITKKEKPQIKKLKVKGIPNKNIPKL